MIGALLVMSQVHSPPYVEPFRPTIHFTARSGWINDPNGLVYFKRNYHLFFQHNPFGVAWGNMTWGHAVSPDLVHWTQLDEAIRPDDLGTIFSGSAVVDVHNTAGFGAGALACIYTSAGGTNEASKGKPFTQSLVFSTDGLTFAKFTGNPVLGHIAAENRDPKVIWHESSRRWIMALYLDGNRYALLASPDLKAWKQTDTVEIADASECPDIFELPLDGDRNRMKWVFWGAGGHYLVGSFDGTKFTAETGSIRSNFGNTSYAAQTYFNDPKGRRIQIGWLNGSEFPGAPWNQQMGFPTELRLVSTPAGPRLTFRPVDEVRRLYGRRLNSVRDEYEAASGAMDISLEADATRSEPLVLEINGHPITYDVATHELCALDKKAILPPHGGQLNLRILVDRASIEIFAQDGLVNMPLYVAPKAGSAVVQISGAGHAHVDAHELKNAWAKP